MAVYYSDHELERHVAHEVDRTAKSILADHEAALANERMPPDGYSLVETATYNGLREAMIAVADENAALKKALAEKDAQVKVEQERIDNLYKTEYDSLMAQAVQFAEELAQLWRFRLNSNAEAFLRTPEVQVFQAQQKDGGVMSDEFENGRKSIQRRFDLAEAELRGYCASGGWYRTAYSSDPEIQKRYDKGFNKGWAIRKRMEKAGKWRKP